MKKILFLIFAFYVIGNCYSQTEEEYKNRENPKFNPKEHQTVVLIGASPNDDAMKYYDNGKRKTHSKDYQGAILDYNKAINLDPNFWWVYFEKALAKYELQDFQGAIADYTKAIILEPKCTKAYSYRAFAKYELQDYRGVIADCNKALELSNNFPAIADSFFYRGNANRYLGQKENACLDYSKAGEFGQEEAYEMIKKYCN